MIYLIFGKRSFFFLYIFLLLNYWPNLIETPDEVRGNYLFFNFLNKMKLLFIFIVKIPNIFNFRGTYCLN